MGQTSQLCPCNPEKQPQTVCKQMSMAVFQRHFIFKNRKLAQIGSCLPIPFYSINIFWIGIKFF